MRKITEGKRDGNAFTLQHFYFLTFEYHFFNFEYRHVMSAFVFLFLRGTFIFVRIMTCARTGAGLCCKLLNLALGEVSHGYLNDGFFLPSALLKSLIPNCYKDTLTAVML